MSKEKIYAGSGKEFGQYGKTHYVEIDTWKPEEKKETQESDYLPF